MSKGKRIAPELQSELVEYSSLLRALKTRNTLDVTTQLQKYYEDNTHDSSDDDRAASDSPSLSSSPVAGPSSSSGSKRKASDSPSHSPSPQKKAKRSRKIGWTRWPLELEDVENPQWTLEDEIAAMIPQHIERTYDDDGNEDEAESANYLPHLVLSTSHFLHTILAAIASYTQPRADSLQNRYNPIDWKFVLNVMATQKNIDPTYVHSPFPSNFPKQCLELYKEQKNVYKRRTTNLSVCLRISIVDLSYRLCRCD